jgi:hypothetical protein
VERHRWRVFRQRFDNLRLKPFLDYTAYRRGEGGIYRFIGGFESVTDRHTLWIRNDELTIPVSLAAAHTYVLPMEENDKPSGIIDPGKEAPARINWDRVASLTEGAKVFVGGLLLLRDNRLTFVSNRDNPLLVIFYDGPDRSLTARTIQAGRDDNEYWNFITPYALILGAFSQIMLVLNLLQRPAFRLTMATALVAMFLPLFPLIPPGFGLTLLYKRLWWHARVFRAYRDLTRLPLKYLPPGTHQARLPDGEIYRGDYRENLPDRLRTALENQTIPLIIPEKAAGKNHGWYICGTIPEPENEEAADPKEPGDVFATYGAIPGNPEKLARDFTLRAYILEIIAWILLLAGIGLNTFFIGLIIFLLN